MYGFQCLFSSRKLAQRSLIFSISLVIIITLCIFHRISGQVKTLDLIEQMLRTGNLTGKFWGVIKIQAEQITITKYQRTITLAYYSSKDVQIGDKISFVAKAENANSRPISMWRPTKIHFHGTSSFKYGISVLSVLIVLYMSLRYFRFDRKSFSIIFKEGND